MDLSPVKQELKGGGGGKHQPPLPPPQSGYLPPAPPPAQKLSLDKYREKHAAELLVSSQKRCVEQHGGAMDCDRGDAFSSSSTSLSYAPSFPSQVDHRKHSQPHQISHSGGGDFTVSPVKMKGPPSASMSGHDKRHHGDKRDKGALKVRLAVPGAGGSSQGGGQSNKDELRMKIKVSSSERHSSSDEGAAAVAAANSNSKSKHSSPLVSKEKHRGAEHHGLHRHHKHSHPHPHAHSGNGRTGPEGLLRAPPGLVAMDGTPLGPLGSTSMSSSSSRKRLYPEAGHNHHHHPSTSFSTSCSKVSKLSKGGSAAAGTAFCLLPSALSSSPSPFPLPLPLFILTALCCFLTRCPVAPQVGCGPLSSTLLPASRPTRWGSKDTEPRSAATGAARGHGKLLTNYEDYAHLLVKCPKK